MNEAQLRSGARSAASYTSAALSVHVERSAAGFWHVPETEYAKFAVDTFSAPGLSRGRIEKNPSIWSPFWQWLSTRSCSLTAARDMDAENDGTETRFVVSIEDISGVYDILKPVSRTNDVCLPDNALTCTFVLGSNSSI